MPTGFKLAREIALTCWVSHAVRPTKISTPAIEMTQSNVPLFTNILTMLAIISTEKSHDKIRTHLGEVGLGEITVHRHRTERAGSNEECVHDCAQSICNEDGGD